MRKPDPICSFDRNQIYKSWSFESRFLRRDYDLIERIRNTDGPFSPIIFIVVLINFTSETFIVLMILSWAHLPFSFLTTGVGRYGQRANDSYPFKKADPFSVHFYTLLETDFRPERPSSDANAERADGRRKGTACRRFQGHPA
jgi:hypothetical protein